MMHFWDYVTLLAFIGWVLGFLWTIYGIFLGGDFVAVGLPLWILSTVYFTKDLTYDFPHDINMIMNKESE